MSALYIHIPFCAQKCFYCSFVVAIGQTKRASRYVDCLLREADACRGTAMETVYVGGGTPTTLSVAQFKKLFEGVHKKFAIKKSAEWTVEANPERLTFKKLSALRKMGVNRLSLGVQSFHPAHLRTLGRIHTRRAAIAAFRRARAAGFDNINIDLMCGFPGCTKETLAVDIQTIHNLQCDHVSVYMLSVEPNSRFYARRILEQEDEQAAQYGFICGTLRRAGFRQYEVSNFARPGKRSRHNENYWKAKDYIGLGVGAHSHRRGRRYWNTPRLLEYIEKAGMGRPAADGEEILSTDQRFLEKILFGLRMTRGVDIAKAEKDFQCMLDQRKRHVIEDCVREKLLTRCRGRLAATAKGFLVLDEICARLI